MKVEFVKDHVEHKAGDKADVTDGLGNYLVRVGAATSKEKVEIPGGAEKTQVSIPAKKEIDPKKEKVIKTTSKEKVEI